MSLWQHSDTHSPQCWSEAAWAVSLSGVNPGKYLSLVDHNCPLGEGGGSLCPFPAGRITSQVSVAESRGLQALGRTPRRLALLLRG